MSKAGRLNGPRSVSWNPPPGDPRAEMRFEVEMSADGYPSVRVTVGCASCKHWRERGDEPGFRWGTCERTVSEVCDPREYVDEDDPRHVPLERRDSIAVDGSGYHAALLTAEDFGCVKWEVKAE